ncbi:unnamed protein product [Durusdinium trenchii]
MISGSQYNTDLVDDFKKVVGALQDKWPDVLHEDPLLIKEGGREAPFSSVHFGSMVDSTDKVKSYKCGQNWFRHNMLFNPAPGAT